MNRTMSSLVRVTTCALFLLLFLGSANAQFKAGIQGTVTDSGGGLVPEAKVTLLNTETGKTQETTTSAEGFYRLSGLPPAKYKLTVEKAGYKQAVFDDVAVNAEATQGEIKQQIIQPAVSRRPKATRVGSAEAISS